MDFDTTETIEGLGTFSIRLPDEDRLIFDVVYALIQTIGEAFEMGALDEFVQYWRSYNDTVGKIVSVSPGRPKILSIEFSGEGGSAIQNPLATFEAMINASEDVGTHTAVDIYDRMIVRTHDDLLEKWFYDQSIPQEFRRHTRHAALRLSLYGEVSEALFKLSPEDRATVMENFWQEATPKIDGLLDGIVSWALSR